MAFVAAAVIGATALAGPALAQTTSPTATPALPAAPAGSVQLNADTAVLHDRVNKYFRDDSNVALAKCTGASPKFASPVLTFANYSKGPFIGVDADISADATLKPGTRAGTYPITVTCGPDTYRATFTVTAPQVTRVPRGGAHTGDGSLAG